MKKLKVFESKINEAQSVDIMYALKDIEEFNKGNVDFDETVRSIIKNLGYEINDKNFNNVKDHLSASGSNDKLPKDKDLIKEVINLLN